MSSYFFHTYPDSLKKYKSGRIFLNVYILVLPVSARVYLTQPRTWTRQWMHVYEETLLFKPSLMSQFTVGTNILIISLHPFILHCFSYCLYQIYHNSRPQLCTVHCSRAWRFADFQRAFLQIQTKQHSTKQLLWSSTKPAENYSVLLRHQSSWNTWCPLKVKDPDTLFASPKGSMSYISGERQAPLQQVSFHSFPKTNFQRLINYEHPFFFTSHKGGLDNSFSSRQTPWYHQHFNAVTLPLKLKWRQKPLHGIFLVWKDKTGLTTLQVRERNLKCRSSRFQDKQSQEKNATGNQVWGNN